MVMGNGKKKNKRQVFKQYDGDLAIALVMVVYMVNQPETAVTSMTSTNFFLPILRNMEK